MHNNSCIIMHHVPLIELCCECSYNKPTAPQRIPGPVTSLLGHLVPGQDLPERADQAEVLPLVWPGAARHSA